MYISMKDKEFFNEMEKVIKSCLKDYIFKPLTFFFPMFPFDPLENIRKLLFRGWSKWNIGKKKVKVTFKDKGCNIIISSWDNIAELIKMSYKTLVID